MPGSKVVSVSSKKTPKKKFENLKKTVQKKWDVI